MKQKTSRTEIELPEINEFYTQSREIRREAEIARSVYFHKMVSIAARKIASIFRHIGELFAFAQRMNQKVRL